MKTGGTTLWCYYEEYIFLYRIGYQSGGMTVIYVGNDANHFG
jgi:hypothetical protein